MENTKARTNNCGNCNFNSTNAPLGEWSYMDPRLVGYITKCRNKDSDFYKQSVYQVVESRPCWVALIIDQSTHTPN